MNIKDNLLKIAEKAEKELNEIFMDIDNTAFFNTSKVLSAFKTHRVTDAHFAGTTGYGYNDMGRDTLDKVYAAVFAAEAALVRTGFVSGTHAIAAALFAILNPGDTLLSLVGMPYDTIQTVIGVSGNEHGSLKHYGINFDFVDIDSSGRADLAEIKAKLSKLRPAAVLIQRSKGYSSRETLNIAEIESLCELVKKISPNTVVFVDNCYGEFTEEREPTEVGADIMAGSLIKNPGGGLATTGGYIVGKEELITKAGSRLTAPGIGAEGGASLGQNRLFYQGFFMAPHTTAQALKTAHLAAAIAEKTGFKTHPGSQSKRSDIIQCIELGAPDKIIKFCKGIQSGSPVDSFISPVPYLMPGYEDEVIMAAGTFIQGASIELSADAPMREPYSVFLQGALTYEAGKLGILNAFNEILEDEE